MQTLKQKRFATREKTSFAESRAEKKPKEKVICLIGISTTYFALRGFGIYDSVAEAKKIGFGLAELGATHNYDKNIGSTLKKIKKDFQEMKFTLHGLFPPLKKRFWFNPTEGLTATNKKIVSDFFSCAAIVEAELVSFHPGFANKVLLLPPNKAGLSTVAMRDKIPLEKAFANAFKVFSFAQKLSEKTGIGFAIENLALNKTEKPAFVSKEDYEKAFAQFANTGLLFDYGHAIVSNNVEELLCLHENIKQVHLHWSNPLSKENPVGDNHFAISSAEQLAPFEKIARFGKIPVVFEHGLDVPREAVLFEKSLVEKFLEKKGDAI